MRVIVPHPYHPGSSAVVDVVAAPDQPTSSQCKEEPMPTQGVGRPFSELSRIEQERLLSMEVTRSSAR